MNKMQFLENLENDIRAGAYPKQAHMILLFNACNEEFRSVEIFEKMLVYTNDEVFADRVQYLYNLFNTGNAIFEEFMLEAISEAKRVVN